MADGGMKSGLSQLVSFRLGEEYYVIDIMRVKEIILVGDITRVPEVPEYIEGATNLRGHVIPVVDLRKRLRLPEVARTDETRIMVLNVQGKTTGMIVDAVCEVLRINPAEIEPTPPAISGLGKDYLRGLIKRDRRLLIVLDIERVLGAQSEDSNVQAA